VYTPALRWDNLQETHGPPPPSHPTLISATFAAAESQRAQSSSGFQPLCARLVRRGRQAGYDRRG